MAKKVKSATVPAVGQPNSLVLMRAVRFRKGQEVATTTDCLQYIVFKDGVVCPVIRRHANTYVMTTPLGELFLWSHEVDHSGFRDDGWTFRNSAPTRHLYFHSLWMYQTGEDAAIHVPTDPDLEGRFRASEYRCGVFFASDPASAINQYRASRSPVQPLR